VELKKDSQEEVRAAGMKNHNSAAQRFNSDSEIEQALKEGLGKALKLHRSLGNPLPISVDGKIVWVNSDDIPDAQEN
jgi:hypothetical protein